ncbi:hypothetical protein [Neorhizobium sp. JUb45]|uniref:hypothetical protein n=1 Tax=unclassified Neorhizobium TaxID=2629175 RepID=UPI00105078BC|nr:hypothetical protein [Neorhizobium sp. JUb45]
MGKNKLGEGEREHRCLAAPWQRLRDQNSGKNQCSGGVSFFRNARSWNIVPGFVGAAAITAKILHAAT